jgi:hypothetical protein
LPPFRQVLPLFEHGQFVICKWQSAGSDGSILLLLPITNYKLPIRKGLGATAVLLLAVPHFPPFLLVLQVLHPQ